MPTTMKILCFPILLLTLVACSSDNNSGILPDKLNGFWTSDDARYRDRSLELDRVYVMIGVGRHQVPSVQVIDKIKVVQVGEETTYTVDSTDLGNVSYQITFRFTPINGGEIQFKNQPGIVWKRHTD